MPRWVKGIEEPMRATSSALAERLASELRDSKDSGQPMIVERLFPSDKMSVQVLWDAWDRVPMENRAAVILRAYRLAGERDADGRIALASGLTVPEARNSGMLPFAVIPALRKGDPVTPQQCRQAMLDEGASVLLVADKPQLRFATAGQAEAAIRRLDARLAGSEGVWVMTEDMPRADHRDE